MSSDSPFSSVDRRITDVRHLNLPYTFTPPDKKEDWNRRSKSLKEHILASLGLWPMPEKCPLNAEVFDRIERDDYSVEKVYFESFPGFFVTGNLYRPMDTETPCPGILNPHGHWEHGRLEDSDSGSIPARCINFARQGSVAFSWDMIGYNDSKQLPHREARSDREQLWGISIMGLQLWNSIRSIDFLESLPDVDNKKIACTGESGGGTQTFMLTAVDDRIMLSAPVNMISAHMQGGCGCENGPHLRVDTNNMEIGAMMAPRPMIMISATGDWTVNTPEVEFPAIQEVYRLFEAEDKIAHTQIDADHNYNLSSRNAVYPWFGKWLFDSDDTERFTEKPFTMEKPEDLLVFNNGLPDHAVDEETLVQHLINQSEKQLNKIRPETTKDLRKFRQVMNVAYRAVVNASVPSPDDLQTSAPEQSEVEGIRITSFNLGRKDIGDRIPVTLYTPKSPTGSGTIVIHPDGGDGLIDTESKTPGALIMGLLDRGQYVITVDLFMTGSAIADPPSETHNYLTTYNPTKTVHRVQDIITCATYLREHVKNTSVSLIGLGKAGLWGLLACGLDPHIFRAVIDTDQFDNTDDQSYLDHLPIPCFRRIGDLRTAATLAAPAALILHNTGPAFQTEWIEDMYRVADARDRLRINQRRLPVQDVISWVVEGPSDY